MKRFLVLAALALLPSCTATQAHDAKVIAKTIADGVAQACAFAESLYPMTPLENAACLLEATVDQALQAHASPKAVAERKLAADKASAAPAGSGGLLTGRRP